MKKNEIMTANRTNVFSNIGAHCGEYLDGMLSSRIANSIKDCDELIAKINSKDLHSVGDFFYNGEDSERIAEEVKGVYTSLKVLFKACFERYENDKGVTKPMDILSDKRRTGDTVKRKMNGVNQYYTLKIQATMLEMLYTNLTGRTIER